MGIINFFINLLKDPRTAIASWISMGVAPTLGFIFLIVFVETGVVFFPFLPGDSLLFAAGFFAAPDAQTGVSALPLFALLPVVWCAPIIGDQCNYWIGHFFGRRIIESGRVKAMTPERLAKTEGMIEKVGPARRVPRPFLPVHPHVHAVHFRHFRHALEPFHPVLRARRPVLVHPVHAARLLLRRHSGRAEAFRTGHHCDSRAVADSYLRRLAQSKVRQKEG